MTMTQGTASAGWSTARYRRCAEEAIDRFGSFR
jgi:hypothetical protein